jgi:hypothetical protein
LGAVGGSAAGGAVRHCWDAYVTDDPREATGALSTVCPRKSSGALSTVAPRESTFALTAAGYVVAGEASGCSVGAVDAGLSGGRSEVAEAVGAGGVPMAHEAVGVEAGVAGALQGIQGDSSNTSHAIGRRAAVLAKIWAV